MNLLREDGYLSHDERPPEQPWPRRVLLPGFAMFLGWACLLMIAGYPLSRISLAIGPCQTPGWQHDSAFWLMWAGFAVGALLMFRAARHRSPATFAVALALLTAVQGWNAYAKAVEQRLQGQCSLRNVDQAMAWCRADPAVYRKSLSAYGSPLLTLVAPGTTDQAWQCLMNWQDRQAREPSWSVVVDESVYGPRRR